MTKQCIACGMPMKKPEDYASADPEKTYCRYCARPDGSMQSFDEKLDSMSGFLVETQGLDAQAARAIAAERMASLPAWKDRGE